MCCVTRKEIFIQEDKIEIMSVRHCSDPHDGICRSLRLTFVEAINVNILASDPLTISSRPKKRFTS